MRKASGKAPKGKKTTKVKDLTVKDAKAVKGGTDSRIELKAKLSDSM